MTSIPSTPQLHSHNAKPRHTTPHHTTPHHTTPSHATPHHTTSHQTTPHHSHHRHVGGLLGLVHRGVVDNDVLADVARSAASKAGGGGLASAGLLQLVQLLRLVPHPVQRLLLLRLCARVCAYVYVCTRVCVCVCACAHACVRTYLYVGKV